MRKLLWFTIGFSGACAIGALWQDLGLLMAGICCLLLSLLAFLFRSSRIRKVAVMLLGFSVGLLWTFSYYVTTMLPLKDYTDQQQVLDIEVVSFPEELSGSQQVRGKTEIHGKTYLLDVVVSRKTSLVPGDRLSGTFYLRNSQNVYSLGQGIFLRAYGTDTVTLDPVERISWRYLAPTLREKLLDTVTEIFPEDTIGFAQALILGQRESLSETDTEALQNSGISHVVSVSGMHVSILFGLIYELCRKRKWLSAAIGVPILVLFAAINGFSPSATRACIMQILLLVSLLANREYDGLTALAFSVLVILAIQPFTVLHPGFQLSVGSMLGIFLFSPRLFHYWMDEKRLGRFKGKHLSGRIVSGIVRSFSVTLSAMVFTIPFSVYYFSVISLISPVTNLLTLGLITMIFYGVLGCLVLGLIWTSAGSVLAWCVSWPIRFVMLLADALGSLPYATVNGRNLYIALWLLFSYGLLLFFLISRKRRPLLLGACIVAGLVGSVFCHWMENANTDFQLTVLDVGQGQCIILQNGGSCYIVDCGGSSGKNAANLACLTLRDYGISTVDGLILTHFDRDHSGGVLELMEKIPVKTLYLPVLEDDTDQSRSINETDLAPVQYITGQWQLPAGEGTITLYPAEKGATSAESGLCILFQGEFCDILITGDRDIHQEQLLLESASLPDIEILIAGHHGSGSSTGYPLLAAVTPEVVIVSSGENSGYDHPNPEMLERVEEFGCRILRTDLVGTIIIGR